MGKEGAGREEDGEVRRVEPVSLPVWTVHGTCRKPGEMPDLGLCIPCPGRVVDRGGGGDGLVPDCL